MLLDSVVVFIVHSHYLPLFVGHHEVCVAVLQNYIIGFGGYCIYSRLIQSATFCCFATKVFRRPPDLYYLIQVVLYLYYSALTRNATFCRFTTKCFRRPPDLYYSIQVAFVFIVHSH